MKTKSNNYSFFFQEPKPFLKWAGGKSQLIDQFDPFLNKIFTQGNIERYIEPFVGGGAVFFHVFSKYRPKQSILADINPELILAYETIKRDVNLLIDMLKELEKKYHSLVEEERQKYFYIIRDLFNQQRKHINYTSFSDDWIERTGYIIFLNRTCFNGLFRVNSQGEFNVPFGRYKNPTISDPDNLQAVWFALQNTTILCRDFKYIEEYVDSTTFVYFDPPYRPISKTANFTSYSKDAFDDVEQIRLADFYRKLDAKGGYLMLSNSDPKNEVTDDDFFERAYRGFYIERVKALRMINSNADKRGPVNELLIFNKDPNN